jgi:hypothetical protein
MSLEKPSCQKRAKAFIESARVCYNLDCFYCDKTDNTCVGSYKACTVKQTER